MNKSVYLAGAMSCYFNTEQYDYPLKWREDVKEYVRKLYDGITIISPTDFYEIGKDYHHSEKEVMRFDLRMVMESDAVLVNLKDLHTSIGTSDEILYAFIKNKPLIGFIDSVYNYKKIHPWKLEQIDRIEVGENSMKKAIDYIYRYYVDRKN